MTKVDKKIRLNDVNSANKGDKNGRSEGRNKPDAMSIEREYADRIAAAEAMSCLSSVVLLPSNSEEMLDISQRENEKLITEAMAKVETKTKTVNSTAKSRRGKTKTVTKKQEGGKKLTNQNPVSGNGKSKGKTKNMTKGSEAVSTTSHIVTGTQNSTIPIHVGNAMTLGAFRGISIEKLQNLLRERKIAVEQSQVKSPSVHTTPVLSTSVNRNSDLNANVTVLNSNPVLRLPLLISNSSDIGGTDLKDVSRPASVKSTDSFELTPSTVDTLLSTVGKQSESLESSLPLKKRKILGIKQKSDELSTPVNNGSSIPNTINLIDLTMEDKRQPNENKTQTSTSQTSQSMGPAAVSSNTNVSSPLASISVDPKTSLMLLTEVQLALQQDEDGDLPLHIAVVHENIVMVQKFVHLMTISGKNVDRYNKAQQTPLHLAVELKFIDALQILLMAGANPNLVNKRGENSIHLSVKYNIIEALRIMIEKSQHQLDLNTRNFEGLSPLHTAVCKNNRQMVKLLLEAGADINILDGKCGKTPLFYAVEFNNTPLVDLFQSKGANIDLPNYAGITAAMAAQARGFQESQMLLMRGGDGKSGLEGGRERMITPSKKVPIPRIPSKSHLIAPEGQTNTEQRFKPVQNSDSNDSSSWSNQSNSTIQNKVVEEPMEIVETRLEIVERSKPVQSSKHSSRRSSPAQVENNLTESEIVTSVSNSKSFGTSAVRSGSVMTSEGHVTSVNASTATLLAKRLLSRQMSASQKPLDLSAKSDQLNYSMKTESSVR